MTDSIRRVAVLTSGTDGPGMNAAIRAVVRMALYQGWSVWGVRNGFAGLVAGDMSELDSRSVSHMIEVGGTFLGTSQSDAPETPLGRRDSLRNLNELGINALVVIGGSVGMRGGHALDEAGFPTVAVPATIENDVWGIDKAIGVDTAMNTAIDAMDRIKDTASSQQQAFIIEIMGDRSGYLTLMAGIAGGAEMTCIPEVPYTLEDVAQGVADAYVRGKEHCVIVVAEGAEPDARAIQAHLADRRQDTGFESFLTMLGHIQRGGAPLAKDRFLATRLGAEAVRVLADGEHGVMVGTDDDNLVRVPLEQVIERRREIDEGYLELARVLAR